MYTRFYQKSKGLSGFQVRLPPQLGANSCTPGPSQDVHQREMRPTGGMAGHLLHTGHHTGAGLAQGSHISGGKLPIIKEKVAAEIHKATSGVEEQFEKSVKGLPYVKELPKTGMPEEQVMKMVQQYKTLVDIHAEDGKVSGAVYKANNPALLNLVTKVYNAYAYSNPLHPDLFPDVRKMEAEIIRMTCGMFNGDSEACGTLTSGGTESIMLACKAYRNRAYDNGIRFPEMIVPLTGHAAFDKAAFYFRIKIVHIPIDPKTFKADVKAMKRAINGNTCMLVGSGPGYPHGVIDPIEDIAKLGKKYNIPVHVDCCLGGFVVPFMEKVGFPIARFDFRLPGVTSISADTHKYGFAPKGSSVVMYKNKDYRRFQFFMAPDWQGGIYATATFAGSRAGANVATCWATMMYIGESGYLEYTRRLIETARYIEKGLKEIKGLYIMGEPEVTVIAFASLDFNIFRLNDMMGERGWHLNPLQFPSGLHICVTLPITEPGAADRFLSDVRECTAVIMLDPNAKVGGMAALYGMAQSIPDRNMVAELAGGYLDATYSTGTSLPNGTHK
ncbi:sphingosine-1-phosphate lyase-like isoform X2 [Lineus longissimus]|uniref:sphingosine-1-phosphate lyase-like isoform X2 n=1 Tax=Lineus longissimus TaxID=88925 RepID=UPI00315CDAFC